jgi:plastocyanin
MDMTTVAVVGGVVIAVVLLLLVGILLVRRGKRAGRADSGGASQAGATQVAIQDFAFQPASVTVPAGTTVSWTNHDAATHTVTFRNGAADSGDLSGGQTFRYTFATPGSFDYYCRIHPSMTGVVVVTP